MGIETDRQIVESVLAGNTAAYGRLYDSYAPLIRAICYDAAGNLADSQDLAQDVFVRAYEKLGRLRDGDSFGKWVVGIAKMRCREWHRQKRKDRQRYVNLDHAESVAAEVTSDDEIKLIREAIKTLPEKERLALHAFYLQDNSAEDAREVLGLSRSGFYRVLERARKRLERLLVKGDMK